MNIKTGTVSNVVLSTSLFFCVPAICWAGKIQRPSGVEEVSAEKIQAAGAELEKYLLMFIGAVFIISCIRPSYLFFTGKSEQAWVCCSDIIIGVVISAILASVGFSVLDKF